MSSQEKQPTYITGVGWRYPVEHNAHRRHRSHDYTAPGTYLVTVVTEPRVAFFGRLTGDTRASRGSSSFPHIELSALGKDVFRKVLPHLRQTYPMAEVWYCCLMLDHIHLIIRVTRAFPMGKNLGNVVGSFKGYVSRAWWDLSDGRCPSHRGYADEGITLAASFPHRPLFAPGYNDRILMNGGQLAAWRRYLDDNPLRLLIRRERPEIMRRALCVTLGGVRFSAFGNFLLLRHPEKRQVFCHRRARVWQLTEGERRQHGIAPAAPGESVTDVDYTLTAAFARERKALVESAEGGTPLVSPAISRGEQTVRNTCQERGLPFIHIQREPITALWKPESARFETCSRGALLILAPWPEALGGATDYEQFHNLNTLAARVCGLDTTRLAFGYRCQA